MRFRGTVSTDRVGSRSTFTFEIDDEDLEDLTGAEREEFINDSALHAMLDRISWDYEPIDPQ